MAKSGAKSSGGTDRQYHGGTNKYEGWEMVWTAAGGVTRETGFVDSRR